MVASGTPTTRLRMAVVMNSEVAVMICSRRTRKGRLAASAGAKTWPTALKSRVMTISGQARFCT